MAILFIHGAGANPSVWHFQIVHFNDSMAVELPGHPNGTGLRSVDDYARVVERQIDEAGITDPILVGHSMGGTIAIEVALGRQELSALVLVGTGARLRVRTDFLAKVKEDYEKAAELLASWSVSASADPILVDRIARDLVKVKPEVTLGDFVACDKFDRMNRVGEIACRTLVVCGEDDRMTPRKYSQYLHERIKNSKLVIIPGAGHSVMLEKPHEFNRVLDEFFVSL
ncbi:MAG TPA: alpha/beta hydrolase [Candidatus Dormibacteraeota bacterium]|nr:alpha/beta hydrolase [Candidatus Dormibacteraeota bacterium]